MDAIKLIIYKLDFTAPSGFNPETINSTFQASDSFAKYNYRILVCVPHPLFIYVCDLKMLQYSCTSNFATALTYSWKLK